MTRPADPTPPEPAAGVPAGAAPESTSLAVPQAPAPAAPAATPTPVPPTSVEAPSGDVAAAGSAALPGAHHGGFRRELTAPVPITETTHDDAEWATPPTPAPAPVPISAPWALSFGILGLLASFLVGWGFPIGLVGAGLAIAALRRPWESRGVAAWALCLSILSVLYSAGWLWWAISQELAA